MPFEPALTNRAPGMVQFWAAAELIIRHRQSGAALRGSESRLRLAVQAASIGLWDWDLKTNRRAACPRSLLVG